MADLRKVLGERIRSARIRLSLSQQQLARELGFSASQIISQIHFRYIRSLIKSDLSER